jgi:hypothetical protein
MASEQKTVNVAIPAEVYERLQTEADAKGCSVVELIPDMLQAYRLGYLQKHREEIRAILASHPPTPYTEEDVPRLVKEVRKELAAERRLENRP